MKFIFVLVLLVLVEGLEKSVKKDTIVGLGISEVIKSHYVKNSIAFDIIVYGQFSQESKKLMSSVIKTNKENYSIKILKLDGNANNDRFKLTQSAILFFDSPTSFLTFNRKVQLANQYTKPLSFLVYFEASSKIDVRMAPALFPFQFNLFHDIDGSLRLAKYFGFLPNLCHRAKMENINRFSSKTLKWEQSISLDHETEDFCGCELTIGVTSLSAPSTYYAINDDGTYEYFGFTVSFINALAKHFNFKVVYNPFDIIRGEYLNKTFKPEFGPSVTSLLHSNNSSELSMDSHTDFHRAFVRYHHSSW